MSDRGGLSRALGWFSLALGAAELAAPRSVARLAGMEDGAATSAMLRVAGARELAAGMGLLVSPRSPGWMGARVAGDTLDLAMLGAATRRDETDRGRLTVATALVAGVTLLDAIQTQRLRSAAGPHGESWRERAVDVRRSVTIERPAHELYERWRRLEDLPRFFRHLHEVRVTGERTSRWTARAPLGRTISWDAELTEDRPDERLAWRSLPGAPIEAEGSVRFVRAPGDRGTEVHVAMRYVVPGGKVGATIAKLLGEAPEQQIRDDLRAFKQIVETGEVVRSDATIHPKPHAARPPALRPADLRERALHGETR